jgi:hypothetical protein
MRALHGLALLGLAAGLAGCESGTAASGRDAQAAGDGPGAAMGDVGADTFEADAIEAATIDLAAIDGVADAHAPTPGVDDEAAAACRRICSIQAMTQCPRFRDCLQPCLMRLAGPRCKNTERALVLCAQNVTVADFDCDTDGTPFIKDDVCPAEAMDVSSCARTGLDVVRGDGPDGGTDTGADGSL